ncbi:MFS transporter [Halorarius litoreus]|uniref:MFS transporter n=1 Tax=Halorarius litoreus TaxID=2962676 RepID=UPI00331392D8
MLLSLAVAWAVLQTGRFLLSPLLPDIIASLDITKATAGIALGAFQGVYALTQYPSGRLSDELTRAALLLPGFAVLVVGFLALGNASTYAVFLVAALFLGVGKGLFAIPSRALLSDLFVERRGRALGIYTAGTDVGGIAAAGIAFLVVGGGAVLVPYMPVAAVFETADWRTPFVPVAIALGLTGVLYAVWTRDSLSVGGADIAFVSTVRRLATTREQRETLVAYALFYFMVGAWINFLPTYLVEAKGLASPLPELLFAVVFVVGVTAKPTAGTLSDRFPRRYVAVAGFVVAVVALVAVVLAESVLALAAAIALFALGYKTQFPVVDAILLDAAPDANVGGDLGAARALFLGVGALGPVYMGVVSTTVGYPAAFAGLVACLVVSAGILAAGARR